MSIERAFQMAHRGGTLREIRNKLMREGHLDAWLTLDNGPLRGQLQAAARLAQENRVADREAEDW